MKAAPPQPPPCANCSHPHACIGLGPPILAAQVRLCWECFLMTPNGVAFTQQRLKQSFGDIDELLPGETMADDEQAANRDP